MVAVVTSVTCVVTCVEGASVEVQLASSVLFVSNEGQEKEETKKFKFLPLISIWVQCSL